MRIACLVYFPPRTADDPARLMAESRAASIFGGFTWLPVVTGGWVHPETRETMTEPMAPLCVAVDTLGDLALLVAYARAVGACYGEHSVYVQVGSLAEVIEVNG